MTPLIETLKKDWNIEDTDNPNVKKLPAGNGYFLLFDETKDCSGWIVDFEGKPLTLNDSTINVHAKTSIEKFIQAYKKAKLDAMDFDVEETQTNGYKDGGYSKMKEESFQEDDFTDIRDTTYENVGEQKKVPLPKPGRRIKNMVSELMEGGTIRAGEKVINSKTGKPVPTKTDYFIITTKTRKNAKDKSQPDLGYEKDEEIHKIIGEDKPTKLKIRLACDREDLNFITYYGKYKSAMCECRGDGYSAETSDGILIECHGEDCESFKKKECKKHGVLSVILEDAPRFGIIYKFRTTSRNSISYLDASLALLTAGLNGHIAGAPLWLTLTPKETVIPDGSQKGMRTTIYAANLEFRGAKHEMETYLQKTLTERAGKDPILGVERVMEASLALPESLEEQKDISETFFPE